MNNPIETINRWKTFVNDMRTQTLNLAQILSNVGVINPVDFQVVKTLLSANLEAINNPDVIGK
jgi:hypothetical protein